jgi:homoserine acetyltransferase
LETLSSCTDDPTAKIRLIRQLGMGGIPNAVGGPMGGMEVLGECLRLAGARVKELRAMIQ